MVHSSHLCLILLLLHPLCCSGLQAIPDERDHKSLLDGGLYVVTGCVGQLAHQDVEPDGADLQGGLGAVQHASQLAEEGAVILCGMQLVPNLLQCHNALGCRL